MSGSTGGRSRGARLRESFWLLPAALCVLAAVLAELLILADQRLGEVEFGPLRVLVTRVGAAGSRDLLGAIAGSMLTVASTTFSITIAALALASSTYGPRLVRNFTADRGNQFVLGVFLATFLYSLLVLRSIRVVDEGGEQIFVPHLAVNVAVLLAVLALGVLVYFIHHIADSIQVWTLARQVRTDLLAVVDRLYPERLGAGYVDDAGETDDAWDLHADGEPVSSHNNGYVQGVDLDALLALAAEHDLVVQLRVRPGSRALTGAPLAVLSPPTRVDDAVAARVRRAVLVGQARTPDQDVEFAVLLLEEMAVRALSPGTNDPYTALNALDDLAAGLVALAGRRTPSPYRYDEHGQLRVVAPAVALGDLLDHLLDAVRWYAVEHPTVLHRTLDLVEQVGAATSQPAVRVRLDTHVEQLAEAFTASSPQHCDATAMTRHAEQVRRSLAGRGVGQYP